MTRVDEFDSFYAATFHQATRVTYALCGERQLAAEATVDAYRRAWRDWSKIREHRPLAYIHTEAWKIATLRRGTHPLRRKASDDADSDLLHALHALPIDDRRLIVLMTLGDTDLEAASQEVGVTAEVGVETVTNALAVLEKTLGQSLDQLERNIRSLGADSAEVAMPASSSLRELAKRGRRRNTAALVAASIALIAGGGWIVAEGGAMASRAELPYREKIGAERPDAVLDAQKLDTKNLLSTAQVARLGPDQRWSIVATDQDVNNEMPYSTCPPRRFANANPLKVFVRTYKSDGADNARVAQSIEVATSESGAEKAYEQLVQWYSDCEHPRTRLISSYTVRRPFGDFRILRLRSYREGVRTFTVGFSHSGLVTSTLVHEVEGSEPPSIEDFARTLNNSVSRICADSGGECTDDIEVVPSLPPPTTVAPEFLGIVDLTPISDIDRVWSGVDPGTPKINPAATSCDAASFSGKHISSVGSRTFVIPEASELPKQFGIAETVGSFDTDDRASDFVASIRKKIADCPKNNLAVDIDQVDSFKGEGFVAYTWRIGFELKEGGRAYFKMALLRRGNRVAQVTFTPSGKYDMSTKDFAFVANRAAQRLAYLK